MSEILLIDFSSILHATFHAESTNPNPDATSVKVIERVRALAGQKPAAICCEGKGSFRKALDPTYKSNRPAPLAELHHQGDVALDVLRGDGFPVWSAAGYEADDVIATAVKLALAAIQSAEWQQLSATPKVFIPIKSKEAAITIAVTIASADKDLLQLVGPRVSVHSLSSGKTLDEAAVVEKLGVAPHQVVDYLALVGDSSDNIKGAQGVGPKGAVKLLNTFGNLDDMFKAIDAKEAAMSEKALASLAEFRPRMPLVRELITLKTDAPIPFDEVFRERQAADVAVFGEDDGRMADINETMQTLTEAVAYGAPATPEVMKARYALAQGMKTLEENAHGLPEQRSNAPDRTDHGEAQVTHQEREGKPESPLQHGVRGGAQGAQPAPGPAHQPQTALAVVDTLAPVPVEWERQLEPRSLEQAIRLAGHLHASRLFGAYGSPQGVFSTIIAGRELGMDAMASLRAFHIIDNKPTLSAGVIAAMVLKSGKAEYFRCTERTAEKATYATKRKGEPDMTLTFTIDEAKQAWSKDEKAWKASGWGRNPADMNVARASSKLARLVYPDVVFNLYAPEEFD